MPTLGAYQMLGAPSKDHFNPEDWEAVPWVIFKTSRVNSEPLIWGRLLSPRELSTHGP